MIITISREFGSGGRELGKRLSDALHLPCYDNEIIEMISKEGRLPYCATPEELICQRETLDEILAVLALCTPTQRERFLLYALHDFSYTEIAEMCGCTKVAVHYSIDGQRGHPSLSRWKRAINPRVHFQAAGEGNH